MRGVILRAHHRIPLPLIMIIAMILLPPPGALTATAHQLLVTYYQAFMGAVQRWVA